MFHKTLNRRRRGDEGFTLIELLVVVVILGILIGIAIPVYLNYRKSANDKAAQSDLRGAISTLEVCNSENGAYPATATLPGAPCTGQTVTGSTGTTMSYLFVTGTSSYKLVANNSGGSGKWYCYTSATGGSVSALSPNPASAAAAMTACV
jgi:type IV pilus assembly protein PilA